MGTRCGRRQRTQYATIRRVKVNAVKTVVIMPMPSVTAKPRTGPVGVLPGMSLPLVVQKFGGSSLADADRIKRVARRIARERAAGHDLVVIVSAMGDTTDELLGLAAAITDEPDARELDVLLATGEHQSATLVSMALHALGVPAISLTGPQAGITTDGRYGRARIAGIQPRRVRAELALGRLAAFGSVEIAGVVALGIAGAADEAAAAAEAPVAAAPLRNARRLAVWSVVRVMIPPRTVFAG